MFAFHVPRTRYYVNNKVFLSLTFWSVTVTKPSRHTEASTESQRHCARPWPSGQGIMGDFDVERRGVGVGCWGGCVSLNLKHKCPPSLISDSHEIRDYLWTPQEGLEDGGGETQTGMKDSLFNHAGTLLSHGTLPTGFYTWIRTKNIYKAFLSLD